MYNRSHNPRDTRANPSGQCIIYSLKQVEDMFISHMIHNNTRRVVSSARQNVKNDAKVIN